jgi:succinate-semialdehyde dehydrogenase/glutarate-semialdehyde dehydrogenase
MGVEFSPFGRTCCARNFVRCTNCNGRPGRVEAAHSVNDTYTNAMSNIPSLTSSNLWRTQSFIDGAWCDADDNRRFVVNNPADGSVLAEVANCGAAETKRAIAAANSALPAWRAMTAKQRAILLRKWFDLLMSHQDELAQILTAEQGKPLSEAKGEIAFGASFIEWFAEEGKRVYGDTIPSPTGDKRLLVMKQPIGVCAAITPWNFPNAMMARKVAPALAAGCTIVVKPAEQTPLSATAFAALAAQAGIPKGVLNIVTGDSDSAPAIGRELCASPVVRKLSFTGSTEVGRILMRQCADTVKKLSLELGGNAPFIVFNDADLDAAADGVMIAKFRNAGQTCVSPNRIYVQRDVHDAFAEKVAARMADLRVGRGTDPGVNVGPLIDEHAMAKVADHVQDAASRGANVKLGGKAMDAYFFPPTLITNVPQDAKINREETFGPVAPLVCFDTEQDAIRLANDTEFGLASYFYARDVGRVFRVAEAIEAGMVAVNTGMFSNEVAPFGGVKQSGLGREGSKYGIEDYLEIKYICLGV